MTERTDFLILYWSNVCSCCFAFRLRMALSSFSVEANAGPVSEVNEVCLAAKHDGKYILSHEFPLV